MDSLNPRQRGTLVEALGSAVFHGGAAIGDVPALLKRVLQTGAWREFETPTHETVNYDRFEQFVTTPPTRGLGADIALIKRIVGDDAEALDLLDQALKNQHGGDRSKIYIINLAKQPQGTSSEYALRTLREKRPDLHAQVLAGEMSPHAAMVEAGFRRPTVNVPVTDDMMAAAQALKRRLTPEQYNMLFEAIVHIESMESTVDADPADDGKA